MPRPSIIGTLVRRIDMQYAGVTATGRRSNKDYRITLSVDDSGVHYLYSEHGPAGRLQNGKVHVLKDPRSLAAAHGCADALRDSKKNQRDSYQILKDEHFSLAPAAAPNQAPKSTTAQSTAPTAPLRNIASLSDASRSAISNIF